MELLTEHLRTVRLVDHHVHGWFTEPGDRAAFELALSEGGGAGYGFDLPVGVAVRRWCAPLLGLPPLAAADDYWAARCEVPYDELVRTFVGAAGVDHWIVDTGLTPDLVTDPAPRSEVLRLERVGVTDNFFEIGGHSVLQVLLLSQMRKRLNLRFNLTEVIGCATIRAQAAVLARHA